MKPSLKNHISWSEIGLWFEVVDNFPQVLRDALGSTAPSVYQPGLGQGTSCSGLYTGAPTSYQGISNVSEKSRKRLLSCSRIGTWKGLALTQRTLGRVKSSLLHPSYAPLHSVNLILNPKLARLCLGMRQ